MKRAGRMAVAGAVLFGMLVVAGGAEAHTLTKERAHNASLRGAERHCENDPYCDTFRATNCRRPPAPTRHRRRHKVRCDIFLGGTDKVGDWQCTWVDQWSIRSGSNRLRWSQAVYDETVDCHHLKEK
jgi:hypothetical protein